MPVKTRNASSAFISKMVTGYIADIDKQKRPLTGTYRNNWQSHRIKLISMGAFTIDDRKLINAAQRLYVEHIGDNIALDGSTVDFGERDALHYVTYDLQPLVTAALAARRHNRNWLSERAPSGATLAAALNWLTPYALGTRTHEEFVHSSVPFDCRPPRGRPARLFGRVGSETRGRTVSSIGAARWALHAHRAAPGAHAAGLARGLFAVAGALIF